MELADFEALLTPPGQAAIAAAAALKPTDQAFLACLTKLQKRIDTALAKAALETVILRERAQGKFARADAMYFTREALEQASSEAIASYRAARFAPAASAADLGCGIGGDAIALAGVTPTTLVDHDPLRLRMARENLAAYGRGHRAQFVPADLLADPPPVAEALWFDPARRAGGRRKFSVRDYRPPLANVHDWRQRTSAVGAKISPGVDLAELKEFDAEVEFISLGGELKECVLWFGSLRTPAARRATLLPGPHTLIAGDSGSAGRPLSPPRAFLYEPDPAVLRAGLVTTLADQIGAHQLDPDIAYLTADAHQPTPYARAFALDDALPFQLKRLREYLRARGVGRLTVKKRGSPLQPEQLIRQLRLSGPEERIVFLTHVRGKPYALVGRPAPTG